MSGDYDFIRITRITAGKERVGAQAQSPGLFDLEGWSSARLEINQITYEFACQIKLTEADWLKS